MVSVVTMAKLMRKFKFLATFSCIASLMILLASSLYKAWSFFMTQITFALTVVLGEDIT